MGMTLAEQKASNHTDSSTLSACKADLSKMTTGPTSPILAPLRTESQRAQRWQMAWQAVTRGLTTPRGPVVPRKPLCERLRTPPSPFAATRRIPDPSLSPSVRERGQGTGTAACKFVVDEDDQWTKVVVGSLGEMLDVECGESQVAGQVGLGNGGREVRERDSRQWMENRLGQGV